MDKILFTYLSGEKREITCPSKDGDYFFQFFENRVHSLKIIRLDHYVNNHFKQGHTTIGVK